jgi:hypothetical protein
MDCRRATPSGWHGPALDRRPHLLASPYRKPPQLPSRGLESECETRPDPRTSRLVRADGIGPRALARYKGGIQGIARRRAEYHPHMPAPSVEAIVNLCKRRGIVFPSSEIYGGLRSAWDWGPLGIEIKRNVKAQWWRSMVHRRGDVVGLESSILMSPKVWEASGHVATFTDPLVECTNCHHRFRADHVDLAKKCPDCGQ